MMAKPTPIIPEGVCKLCLRYLDDHSWKPLRGSYEPRCPPPLTEIEEDEERFENSEEFEEFEGEQDYDYYG